MNHQHMIVAIDKHTAKLCLSLTDLCGRQVRAFGCPEDCGKPVLSAELFVQRIGCCKIIPAVYKWCGCERELVSAQQTIQNPKIKYPAFDVNLDGDVCFYLDGKLLEAAAGRYSAELWLCGSKAAEFQIELRTGTMITGASTTRARPSTITC